MRNSPPQRAKSLGCEHLALFFASVSNCLGRASSARRLCGTVARRKGRQDSRGQLTHAVCGGLICSIRQRIAPLTATGAWIMLEAACQ